MNRTSTPYGWTPRTWASDTEPHVGKWPGWLKLLVIFGGSALLWAAILLLLFHHGA